MNGGTCTDLNGGFDCTCSFGYKGETCDRKNKYIYKFIQLMPRAFLFLFTI